MKTWVIFLASTLCLSSCQGQKTSEQANHHSYRARDIKDGWIHPEGNLIATRFRLPDGFSSAPMNPKSWGNYLRNLPLKPDGSDVLTYSGAAKPNHQTYLAVVNLPIGTKDLHQCADAVMRLRAEYLFSQTKFNEITFRQACGKTISYTTWLTGKTPDKTNLWTYLETVFNTCNTTSLNQQLKSKPLEKLTIGDVFITGPPPGHSYGHAIIIVDKCVDKNGKVKFMLAQSYMPAQEIQILDNPSNPGCPWYDIDFGTTLHTPEWDFTASHLKSFE